MNDTSNDAPASSPSGDPYLLTPGPLTTSLSVKQAMLHDYGSRDAAFIDLNARILERLVAIVNGQVVYTPNENFNGADAFTYTITDGNGGFEEDPAASDAMPGTAQAARFVSETWTSKNSRLRWRSSS